MLIRIHDDVIDAAVQNDNTAIGVLEKLALAYKYGSHLVSASLRSLNQLVAIQYIPELYRHIYSQIKSREATMQPVYSQIQTYITVSMSPVVGSPRNIICSQWGDFKFYAETHVLVENLSDYEFFSIILKHYQRKQGIKGCTCCSYPIQGGGDAMSRVYKKEIDDKHYFCIALMDSDKKYPSASIGETAKKIISLDSKHHPIHCHYYVMQDVREVENLIPLRIIHENTNYAKYDIFSNQYSFDFSYFDFKEGFNACKKKMGVGYLNYWNSQFSQNAQVLALLRECHECECVCNPTAEECKQQCKTIKLIGGFGSKLLDTILNSSNEKLLACTDADLSQVQQDEWSRIGKVIFEWSCAPTHIAT